MRLLLALCVCLPLSLLAEGGLPNQPYIYIEGTAEIERPADLVTLRFDVVARNADQLKANTEVQAKAAKILGLFNDKKVPQEHVIASDLRSEPQYEDEEKRGKIVGHAVTRSFTTKVRDLATVPQLVDELLGVAGVEFSSIDSGLAKEKELEDEAVDQALTNARDRAEQMLKPLSMKIDAVYAVSPVAFPDIRRKFFGVFHGGTEAVVVTSPSQYRFAPVKINQRVHVIYLISPLK